MRITRRQLKRLISEIHHRGIMSMRDILSDEDKHEIRVIQLKKLFLSMRSEGDSNDEILAAIREALSSLQAEEKEGS